MKIKYEGQTTNILKKNIAKKMKTKYHKDEDKKEKEKCSYQEKPVPDEKSTY